MRRTVRVALEVAPKRSFASALDWPGWSRSGKTPEAALEALLAAAPRYASVAARAGLRPPAPSGTADLDVVERLEGAGGTEFGVPSVPAADEDAPLNAKDLERLVLLLRSAWDAFDEAARAARGVTLTTGPRGGGRDLGRMVAHVGEAEVAYLGQLGSRPPAGGTSGNGMDATRDAFVATLRARVRGEELPNPRRTKSPWSPRYAVRRSAWHSLDHAWELEDRSTGGG